ncbi:MAG: tetratricopeptide repeat protein, partial [Candidatus Saccharicenans sp.]
MTRLLASGLGFCLILLLVIHFVSFPSASGITLPIQTFDSRPEAKIREINLKLAADEELLGLWGARKRVEEALAEVNWDFEKLFGLKFCWQGWSDWKSDDRVRQLEELAAKLDLRADKGQADLLVAVTAQKDLTMEHTGFSLFKSGVVVVIYNSDQAKLRQLLAHELAHVFGAVHVPLADSIMSCESSGNRFDPYNLEIIKLTKNRTFKPFGFPLPPEVIDKLIDEYLKIRQKIIEIKSINQLLTRPISVAESRSQLPVSLQRTVSCLSDCFVVLAQLTLEKKDYQKSGQFLDEALALNPGDPEALNLRAIILRRTGQIDKAIDLYKFLLRTKSEEPTILFNLGIAYGRQNRIQEAEKAYQQALALKPAFVEAHNNLGEIYLRQNRLKEAEKEFLTAIDLAEDFALAYSNLGELYLKEKELSKAKEYVEKALALDPHLTSAHNLKGNIWRQEGRNLEAMAEYRKALELDQGYEKALYNLGISSSDLGQWTEARNYFLQAIKANPFFGEAYAGLGLCFLNEGKWEEAVNNLLKARELGYKNPVVSVNLSYAYISLKDWAKAETEARRAIKEQPDLALAYNNLGIALAQQDKFEEARGALEKALELSPLDRDSALNLAIVELARNNEDRALELFLKTIALNP